MISCLTLGSPVATAETLWSLKSNRSHTLSLNKSKGVRWRKKKGHQVFTPVVRLEFDETCFTPLAPGRWRRWHHPAAHCRLSREWMCSWGLLGEKKEAVMRKENKERRTQWLGWRDITTVWSLSPVSLYFISSEIKESSRALCSHRMWMQRLLKNHKRIQNKQLLPSNDAALMN